MERETGRPSGRAVLRLGTSLRDLREDRGWSRKDLAARAGLSYPYISQLENGDREPSVETLTKLAEAFGIGVDELLARSPDRPPPARTPGTAPASPRWIPTTAHRRQAAAPQSHGRATAADQAEVVERAYQLLRLLPPGARLDAAGALLARCLADQTRHR